MKMGNSIDESWTNSIASVELPWIYSGESEIGIWTTNKAWVSYFVTFFSPQER